MKQNPEATSFGNKDVTPEQKTNMVLGVFDSVADRYDIMNDAMSAGVHRVWKDKLVKQINPQPNHKILDVAGGTGDIAFRMNRVTGGQAHITVSDINESMLTVGRDRAFDKGIFKNIDLVPANAEQLPFKDETFDIYTISFGLRNVTHIDNALKDAARVLKKGGKFYCMEFSHVDNPFLQKAYDLYSEHLIPQMGSIISGDRESYEYLVESIRKFPKRENLKQRLLDAGFEKASYRTMTFGVVAIHEATK